MKWPLAADTLLRVVEMRNPGMDRIRHALHRGLAGGDLFLDHIILRGCDIL